MLKYNFNTKQESSIVIFENVRYITFSKIIYTFDKLEPEQCSIVKLFNNLFIAIDLEKTDFELSIIGFQNKTKGKCLINNITRYFSVHNDILYIGKEKEFVYYTLNGKRIDNNVIAIFYRFNYNNGRLNIVDCFTFTSPKYCLDEIPYSGSDDYVKLIKGMNNEDLFKQLDNIHYIMQNEKMFKEYYWND